MADRQQARKDALSINPIQSITICHRTHIIIIIIYLLCLYYSVIATVVRIVRVLCNDNRLIVTYTAKTTKDAERQ